MAIALPLVILKLSTIYFFVIGGCEDSVPVASPILVLTIVDSSIYIFFSYVTFLFAILVLAPDRFKMAIFCLGYSMQFIFLPFSDFIFTTLIYLNSYSMWFTLLIKIAFVLPLAHVHALYAPLYLSICEAVFDGLKFWLEQPFIVFSIGDAKNGIRENS
jgi:hypothetical protein